MPAEFLPSKKIIVIGSLLAIFIGWLFWVPTTTTFKLKNLELGKKLQTIAHNEQAEIDSDHDNLKDWEEILWHTDPLNPDTDQDGTPDGAEIKLGRNPLVPGPDDRLSDTAALLTGSATGTPQEFNLTESVSQKLLSAYLQSDKKSPEALQNLAQNIAKQTIPPPFQDEFSRDDIIIGSDNSAPTIKKYLNLAGATLAANLTQAGSVTKTLTAVNTDSNYALLADLSKNIDAYRQIAASLKTLVVPSLLSATHLEMLNTANNAARAVLEIQKMETDPLLFSHGWQEYLTADSRSTNIIRDINSIIKSKNIVFAKSDAGYIFLHPETISQ